MPRQSKHNLARVALPSTVSRSRRNSPDFRYPIATNRRSQNAYPHSTPLRSMGLLAQNSGKAPNRRGFVVKHFENRVKLRDLQQILNPFGKIQQLHRAPLIGHRRESRNHFTDSRAVYIAHLTEVQQDFLMSARRQIANGIAKRAGSLAQSDAAHRVHYRYIAHLPGG